MRMPISADFCGRAEKKQKSTNTVISNFFAKQAEGSLWVKMYLKF